MDSIKMAQGELNCGCKVISGFLCGNTIVYCPLHKAAPDLYEACKQTLEITHDPKVEAILMKVLDKVGGK